jgi:unsaturated chondroitin disaccharide hydrolase
MLFMIFISTSRAQYEYVLNVIKPQLLNKIEIFGDKFPEYTVDGKWLLVDDINWFAGFPGGQLWIMYELTGLEQFKELAIIEANRLTHYSNLDNTHDMGFIFLPTCVEAYKHTGEEKYKVAAIQAAEMLGKRFNENGNFIRAWGKLGSKPKAGWMIIDTIMNLELLFWTYQQTGNKVFYNIAVKHANTALKELIRDDYSSYHVIEFDPETGEVEKKRTHQGFGDETTWARGQAWGIYGFAKTFQFTQDSTYLNASKKMSKYFLAHLPADFIPCWDLSLSGENIPRDASAGAIAASGLFLLSELVPNENEKKSLLESAEKISTSLVENYLFTNSEREIEQGILLHTVYNHNANKGVDESYPCGDYYFLESLQKLITHIK